MMAALWKVWLGIALTLLAGVALVTAAVAWLLARGPIDLSFLNPPIEEQLSAIAPGIAAHVGRTEIAWLHHLPEIRVLGVEARRGGTVLLSLPEISIRPSLRALVRANFAVERVNITGVRLSLTRERDGRILLGTANQPAQAPVDLSVLSSAPSSGEGARYFKRIRVRDSALRFEDLGSATHWTAEGVHVELVREVGGFEGVLDARVALESPKAAAIHGFKLPVSASVQLERGEDGSFRGAAFQARGRDGKLAPAGDPGPALPLRSFVAEGRFSGETRRVTLDRLEAAVGSAQVDSTVSFSASDVAHGLELLGELKSLPITELKRLWPRGAAVGAREWIAANIHDGRVSSGRFVIRLPAAGESPHPLPADAVDVKFEFAGLGLRYYGELDPIREARGSGMLSADSFEGRVSQAQVGGLQMQNGRVSIHWGEPVAKLEVKAEVAGPSAAALALVDRPPLHVAEKIGVAPEALGGSSSSHVEVRLPLQEEILPGDVHVAVDGSLTDASLAKLLRGVGFSGGTFAVKVRDGNVDVEGDTTFNGLPGQPAPAHAKVSFEPSENGTENRLQIDVAGQELSAKATATLTGKALTKLTIGELRLAGSDVSGVVTSEGGVYHASLQGKMLDFAQFLDTKQPEDPLEQMQDAYEADFNLERVRARFGIELTGMTGHLAGDGGHLRTLQASGEVVGGGVAHVEFGPRDGKQRLRIRSERAGPLLNALGIFEDAEGGRITMIADMDEGGLGSSFEGRFYARDFKILRASVLARILSLGSLNGIANMLNGKGLEFTRARVPFRWSGTTVELYDALAVGAIGITAGGSIDRTKRWIDLRGRVIPAYTLNSALGKVPLIGPYLVGGKDEGIFGIDFSAKGSLDKPDVNVNPLSALAPGALRKMFVDPFKSDDPDAAAAEPGVAESSGGGPAP
jgi:Protein of unknown function/AsmA-like C-terminal region